MAAVCDLAFCDLAVLQLPGCGAIEEVVVWF